MELYKKHRPKSLQHIEGSPSTIRALKAMLEGNNLPHTILLSGPSGCGKTTIARIIRRHLKCGEMDWSELNCSNTRGIDTIREIQRNMHLAPSGPCRIWLLDEAHQLSKDAQNASLKMFEDTPSHVYFILCTTDPHKLIPTIRNRCSHLPVSLLTDREMSSVLSRIVKRAKLDIPKEIIQEIIAIAGGSARKAVVALDKIRDLAYGEMEDALKESSEEDAQAIELCRALIKGAPWTQIASILKGLKGEPESIRWAVLGYARSVLLGGRNPDRGYLVIDSFRDHFYDSKQAGLAAACYEVIEGAK